MSPTKRYWLTFPLPAHGASTAGHSSMRFYDRGKWSPDTDILEVENGLLIVMDIAGMQREEIRITVSGRVLSVSGFRKEPQVDHKKGVLRLEIDYGHFAKQFTLPEGLDSEQIDARYEGGFLYLLLPYARVPTIDITHA